MAQGPDVAYGAMPSSPWSSPQVHKFEGWEAGPPQNTSVPRAMAILPPLILPVNFWTHGPGESPMCWTGLEC